MSLSSEHKSTIRSWVEDRWGSYVDDVNCLDDAKEDMVADLQIECELGHLGGGDLDEAIDFMEDVFDEQ